MDEATLVSIIVGTDKAERACSALSRLLETLAEKSPLADHWQATDTLFGAAALLQGLSAELGEIGTRLSDQIG